MTEGTFSTWLLGLGRLLSGKRTCHVIIRLDFKPAALTYRLGRYGGLSMIPANMEGADRIPVASRLPRSAKSS